ncbi:hypothetical protein KUCAC02_034887, partial [Chaenocephalus aceratus]
VACSSLVVLLYENPNRLKMQKGIFWEFFVFSGPLLISLNLHGVLDRVVPGHMEVPMEELCGRRRSKGTDQDL